MYQNISSSGLYGIGDGELITETIAQTYVETSSDPEAALQFIGTISPCVSPST